MKRTAKPAAFDLKVEFDRETDGRWIADIPALPGVMVYGRTRKQALAHCVDSGALLFPTHFASPHVARITSSGAGFGVEFVSSGTSGRA